MTTTFTQILMKFSCFVYLTTCANSNLKERNACSQAEHSLSCARLCARESQKPGTKSRRWGCITCYGLSNVRPDDLPAFAVANMNRKYTRSLLASPEPKPQTTEQLAQRNTALKRHLVAARDNSRMSKKRLKVKQEEHAALATQLEVAETSALEKQKSKEEAERVVRKLTFDLKASQEHIPVLQASNAKLEERLARQRAYCVSLQAEISSLKEQVSSRDAQFNDSLGMIDDLRSSNPQLLAFEQGSRWSKGLKQGGQAAVDAAMDLIGNF